MSPWLTKREKGRRRRRIKVVAGRIDRERIVSSSGGEEAETVERVTVWKVQPTTSKTSGGNIKPNHSSPLVFLLTTAGLLPPSGQNEMLVFWGVITGKVPSSECGNANRDGLILLFLCLWCPSPQTKLNLQQQDRAGRGASADAQNGCRDNSLNAGNLVHISSTTFQWSIEKSNGLINIFVLLPGVTHGGKKKSWCNRHDQSLKRLYLTEADETCTSFKKWSCRELTAKMWQL